MAERDQTHWDERYASVAAPAAPTIPDHFRDFSEVFATAQRATEVACGAGRFAVWLAERGVHVTGFDISPVAIAHAVQLAVDSGVSERCSFRVADLDDGLPDGEEADLVVCNMFRDPSLDHALIARLAPGGVLAVAALSEVGAEPGRFRATPGELTRAFANLEQLGAAEADGLAWFVGRRHS